MKAEFWRIWFPLGGYYFVPRWYWYKEHSAGEYSNWDEEGKSYSSIANARKAIKNSMVFKEKDPLRKFRILPKDLMIVKVEIIHTQLLSFEEQKC